MQKFKLYFDKPWLKKGDIFITEGHICKAVVISTPKSRWWFKLLEYLTFKYFKAPRHYTCKILNNE